MQLTEQQRAELERRGWRVKWRTGSFETWEHPAYSVGVHVWVNGEIGAMGNIGEVLEFAAAVGYAPPGYRLVPDAVADYCAGDITEIAATMQAAREHKAMWFKLASALSPKET